MVVKQGTLIDASIIASAARRPRMDEDKISPTDPDARFGTSNERGRFTFGYKLHVAVDAGSMMVRAWRLTPANVQEVSVAPSLLPAAGGTVYADRGYDGAQLHVELAMRGLGNAIMRRANRHRPLSPEEIERNHRLSLLRRPVGVFGTLKRCYGFHRMRCAFFSARRNAVASPSPSMAFNLRRWNAVAAG